MLNKPITVAESYGINWKYDLSELVAFTSNKHTLLVSRDSLDRLLLGGLTARALPQADGTP